jgi:hypothetical protein
MPASCWRIFGKTSEPAAKGPRSDSIRKLRRKEQRQAPTWLCPAAFSFVTILAKMAAKAGLHSPNVHNILRLAARMRATGAAGGGGEG